MKTRINSDIIFEEYFLIIRCGQNHTHWAFNTHFIALVVGTLTVNTPIIIIIIIILNQYLKYAVDFLE